MAYTLQEDHSDAGYNSAGGIYGTWYLCQTFTASGSYDLKKIDIPLCSTGTPPPLYLELWSTSGGEPDSVLKSQLITGALSAYPSHDWVETILDAAYTTTEDDVYAIVVRSDGTGDSDNRGRWWFDTSGSWAGAEGWSNDSGSTWHMTGSMDHLFKIYSELVVPEKPTNPTPSDEDTSVDFSGLVLDWDDGGGADTFDVYIGPVGSLVKVASAIEPSTYTVSTDDVPWGQTISWRIDATNAAGTTQGDVWSFSVVNINSVWLGSAGSFIVVVADNGVFLSTDFGDNWTRKTPDSVETTDWVKGICSDDGTYIIVVSDANAIYRSANSGVAWGAITPAGGDTFSVNDLATSDDGQFMVIVGQNSTDATESCYISSDYGATWTAKKPVATSIEWTECDISNDGAIIAVSTTSYFYISFDSGTTWKAQGMASSVEVWEGLSISGDGTTGLIANTDDNDEFFVGILTNLYSEATWAESALTSAGRAILDDANAAAQATTLGLGTGDAVTHDTLTLSSIVAESSDVDKFLVDSSGVIKYRTGANVLSDIGASASGHNHSGIYEPADAGLTSLAALTYAAAAFVKMTGANTFVLRTIANTKTDLSLNNVENTAHSTDAHTMSLDGRDVSVDGTKLDGIEALADVTATAETSHATVMVDGDFSSNGLMERTTAGSYGIKVIGTDVQAYGAVLDDLNTVGQVGADSEFLVGTGAGALAWENATTAKTSIGLGNVENTQLSTWVGTTNITTLGTITTVGNITVADGGTIGQAAGPLFTFNNTNNFLGITGCHIAVGTNTPLDLFHLESAVTHYTGGRFVNVHADANGLAIGWTLGMNTRKTGGYDGVPASSFIIRQHLDASNIMRFILLDDGKTGIGVVPKTLFTVEGTLTLKEQASADADTAAYTQIWAKTSTPSELWATNDAGTDFQLGGPTGSMVLWTTDTAPSGWLLCYGQAVSRSTYAALYAVISTTFGVGDGSTTFNLPDMRGRFPLGQDNMGGSSADRVTDSDADSIGGADGAETHTLIEAEMPSHTHTYPIWGSINSGTPVHPFDTTGSSITTDITNSTGSGDAHNNMSPYITLNYIIRY